MSFEEKLTWVNTVITIAVAGVYAWIVGAQVAAMPVTEIAYQKVMIISVGAIVVLTIIGAILTAIGSAVGAAIGGEITGDDPVGDIDRKDERDVDINRRGEVVGHYVVSTFVLAALAITMLEFPHFWIANVLFAGFIAAGLTTDVVKIVVYRRGY